MAWGSVVPRGAGSESWGHGRWPGPMHDVRGSDGVTGIGRGGSAPSGGSADHVRQRHRQNG
jgi:hypothetical protein